MNERKMKILEAIINDYILTAEPIGSRTIARKYDFGLSSATIRNEMSDLEEMGYVIAPHTSSGRIPSDKGYRLYVDNVMKKRRLEAAEKELLIQALQRQEVAVQNIMREMANAVAFITNYTIIATETLSKRHKVKQIQLILVEGPIVALIVITDQNAVQNKVLVLPAVLPQSLIKKVSDALTAMLADSVAEDFTHLYAAMLRHHFREKGLEDVPVDIILSAIREILLSLNNTQVHAVGIKNILDFPEFANLEKARAIMGLLEEKENLHAIVSGQLAGEIQVIIGEENETPDLKECSVIKAKIDIDGQYYGQLAIIGPTRMNYAQVMSVLQMVLSTLGVQ